MDRPEGHAAVIYAPRVFIDPEAVEAAISQPQMFGRDAVPAARSGLRLSSGVLLLVRAALVRAAYVISALALFVLALQLLKAGASGLRPLLEGISVHGSAGFLGFGWLGSYLVLSGSPVAAIALSLFAGGITSDTETFAMINGTRFGASFIVLFVGVLLYLRRKRDPDSVYIGVIALLTAFTLWLPVIPAGMIVLRQGWFDGVRFGAPGILISLVDVVYGPTLAQARQHLPHAALFVLGAMFLLVAFAFFDRALPNLNQPSPAIEKLSRFFRHRLAMFGVGSLVTLMTLSVSLSVTLLVPLSLKGYVRRDRVIPYIMGANVVTWVDTLFASLLLDAPRAFTIVFTEMVIGAAVSLLVLVCAYNVYARVILGLARYITASRWGFITFLGVILIVPVLLLAV